MRTIEVEIEIDDEPLMAIVDYEYYPGEPEVWTLSNGDPGHPGSGAECEVLSIQDEFGNTIPDDKISSKWQDIIIEKCYADSER